MIIIISINYEANAFGFKYFTEQMLNCTKLINGHNHKLMIRNLQNDSDWFY